MKLANVKRAEKLNGFTLIELLIACAISVVIVAGATSVLSMGMRAFGTISASEKGRISNRNLLLATQALQADFASAVNLPLERRLVGDKHSVSFYKVFSPVKSEKDLRIGMVEWYRKYDGSLTRKVTCNGVETVDNFGVVPAFVLEYGGTPGEQKDKVEETPWFEEWNGKKLPGIVRVELGIMNFDCAVMCSEFFLDKEHKQEGDE